MTNPHTFHIPVMGIGFTIDTPLKVSQYGMDSVISLVDDILLEKLRKLYCEKNRIQYSEISELVEDFRAKRITSYLNLINELAEKKFEELKSATKERSNDLREYFNMLPESSEIKQEFKNLVSKYINLEDISDWIKDNLSMGSIDVNIMTKIDKDNYLDDKKLPVEYNDAHAALRGYAKSDLKSSIVFSAGMNPRLYGYLEQFEDFYPDQNDEIKKKIILKVSDYRSALIQGKFLAKKGLWVSEYRIESGLNCGGHAFATDGYLLGPVLAEFRDKRDELVQSVHAVFLQGLAQKNRPAPQDIMPIKITAQGGVGSAKEHDFLIDHYQLDSVGWGTPFLLVPEATNVDDTTLQKLVDASEEDLYLSNISPLGVPFNNLRGNTKDIEKKDLIRQGSPGSSCPKKYVALNNEYGEKGLCMASRQYQMKKIEELNIEGLEMEEYMARYNNIVEKSCICVGLGTPALLKNNLDTKTEGPGVSVCPGPNMAYFSRTMSLKDVTNHIYGRANMISRTDRPNIFIKELNIYIDFLRDKINEAQAPLNRKQYKYLFTFVSNLEKGLNYYSELFDSLKDAFNESKKAMITELETKKSTLKTMFEDILSLNPSKPK